MTIDKDDKVTTDWPAIPMFHKREGIVIGPRGVGLQETTESQEFLVEFIYFDSKYRFWIERRYLHVVDSNPG